MDVYYLSLNKQAFKKKYIVKSAYRKVNTLEIAEYIEEKELIVELYQKDDAIFYNTKQHVLQIDYTTKDFIYNDAFSHIYNDITVKVNTEGIIEGIVNDHQLLSRWPMVEEYIMQKIQNKKEAQHIIDIVKERPLNELISAFITNNSVLSLFFNGIYGKYNKGIKKNELLLKNYFGQIDLPILISFTIKEEETKIIDGKGKINEDIFDEQKFLHYIRDALDIFDLETNIKLDCSYTYTLNNEDVITSAEQYLNAEIGNAYNVTLARQLKEVIL